MFSKLKGLFYYEKETKSPEPDITKNVDFSIIRYAMVWEDSRNLREALTTQPGARVLSIAAAGDNSFALLLDDPAQVLMVDISPAQIALCKLKIELIRRFDHQETAFFLGLRDKHPTDSQSSSESIRLQMFQDVCKNLDEETRIFFIKLPETDLTAGVCNSGKIEKFSQKFVKDYLPWAHSDATVRALLACKNVQEQNTFMQSTFNTWLFRWMVRSYFTKQRYGHGRHPSFLDGVDVDIPSHVLSTFQRVLTTVDISDNFWLEFVLMGKITGNNGLPEYLMEENYYVIRSRLDRLRFHYGDINEVIVDAINNKQYFDGFNLSDMFEWMDQDTTDKLLENIAKAGKPGARLVFWNFLKVRHSSEQLRHLLEPMWDTAEKIYTKDRLPFFRCLVIERVKSV